MADNTTLPKDIGAPKNTPPSRLPPNYGSLQGDTFYGEAPENSYHTTQSHPISNSSSSPNSTHSHSFRDAMESFVGSYSRTSVLYVAENLTLPHTVLTDAHEALLESEEEQHYDSSRLRPHSPEPNQLSPILSTDTSTGIHLFPPLSRHTTVASVLSQRLQASTQAQSYTPQSTFLQSVFNSVNVLLGVGMLALPLALRYAGWVWGSLIFVFCSLLTNYTAKLIAKCMDANPGSSTYGDVGVAAFGNGVRNLVSCLFIVELLTVGVAMIVLLGDGIQSLWPELDLITTRCISFVVLTPMSFMSIRKLAYTSLVGIVSCISLVIIVVYDGLSKETKPGSLWEPMETELFPSQPYNIPLAFGIMMSGFAGHAIFPAIYHDMKDQSEYTRMVNWTYSIALITYAGLAVVGYAMFGLETMQEITQNLAMTPGYNLILNKVAVWLIVMTPIAKYGLMMNPIALTWELWLMSQPFVEYWCKYHAWRETFLMVLGRICISGFIVYIATVFPGFDRVMSLLGSLFSFSISAIFPLVCYQQIFSRSMSKKESVLVWLLIIVSTAMACVGTVWTFLPSQI
ncbi:transmembrane amino acid transporter protein-domain-containing protein [Spinellus fusiger]|nr:transmembrane amino acid transporter protein-domain-containing protein [Spinellus fusiger]